MSDVKEKFINEFKQKLLDSNVELDIINTIDNILIASLNNYEIQELDTSVSTLDTSSEQLIKLFIGTLLTEGKSKKTAHLYSRIIHRFYSDVKKPLLEVNAFDIRLWLAKIQTTATPRTCENYRSYLASFYNWLQREEIIARSPMIKVLPIKYEQVVRLPFSSIEIDLLRQACKNPRDRAELELLLSCGARVSEVVAMNRQDIDLITGTVIIREGKGNKQRKTYINDIARKYIVDYLKTRTDVEDALFISRLNKRITDRNISDDLHRLGQDAGVAHVHPHRCRRTFATDLYNRGMDVRTIQLLLGHSDLNTTMTYISVNSEHVKIEYMKHNL